MVKTQKTLVDILKRLYKLGDEFPYSQLTLCLDQKSLFDLMRVFGGQSLYIPTIKEFTQLIQFCIVEEIGSFSEAIAINPEVLNGFTEIKYNRMHDRIYNGITKTKRKKRSNRGTPAQD